MLHCHSDAQHFDLVSLPSRAHAYINHALALTLFIPMYKDIIGVTCRSSLAL